MYSDPTKFKSANILLIAIFGSIAKFNSRQYFRLYEYIIHAQLYRSCGAYLACPIIFVSDFCSDAMGVLDIHSSSQDSDDDQG